MKKKKTVVGGNPRGRRTRKRPFLIGEVVDRGQGRWVRVLEYLPTNWEVLVQEVNGEVTLTRVPHLKLTHASGPERLGFDVLCRTLLHATDRDN